MRTEASLDSEIKSLEQRIRARRIAFKASLDGLSDTATVAKQRVRAKASSPLLWGGALVLGFAAAQVARKVQRKPERPRYEFQFRREKPSSPARKALAGALSIAAPIVMRLARRQAVPLIMRALHAYSRRREHGRYRARY